MSLTPEEVEYIAENGEISFVPNFSCSKMYLINGDVGPFVAGIPLRVPLWVGLQYRKYLKGRIIPPDWLELGNLKRLLDEEKREPGFVKMPDLYFSVAKVILDECPGDVPNSDKIRVILKDIWDVREAKLKSSGKLFLDRSLETATVNNLNSLEIASIRPFFNQTLQQVYRIKKTLSIIGDVREERMMDESSRMESQSQSQSQR